MLRRHFIQGGVLAIGAAGIQNVTGATTRRRFTLQNDQLAWHLDASPEGVHTVALENRLSEQRYDLGGGDDFALVFPNGPRIEIPWWHFRLTDEGEVSPETEIGIVRGYSKAAAFSDDWKAVDNLAGGQKGKVYSGYGWFHHVFSLPETAQGRELVFVLGGYDEQDWNEHWVYLNGEEIGRRSIATRWRKPGRYKVRPTDASYAHLQFGPQSKNILAIRAKGYDYSRGGLRDEALVQYVLSTFFV